MPNEMLLCSEVHCNRMLVAVPELECGSSILRYTCASLRRATLYRLNCTVAKKSKLGEERQTGLVIV